MKSHSKSFSETSVCCTFSIPNSFYTFPFVLESCFLISMLLPLWRLSQKQIIWRCKTIESFLWQCYQYSCIIGPMIAYLSKTQLFHWHFNHQTNRPCSICFYIFFLFCFFSYVYEDKNSHLLISTVTWLGENISCGIQQTCFWTLFYHCVLFFINKKNCSVWKGLLLTLHMQKIRAL